MVNVAEHHHEKLEYSQLSRANMSNSYRLQSILNLEAKYTIRNEWNNKANITKPI